MISPKPCHEHVAAVNRQAACRYGQMLLNVNDTYIGRSLDLYGEFSEGEMELFRQIVQPGHTVLDIGANIGTHTLFFARQVGANGKVLAFEPQRVVFQTLCANMALNNILNAWCFPHAVGAEPGEIVVPILDFARPGNFGGLGLGQHHAGERVPVVTVDSLNLPKCNVIKIDVEGMEHAVLSGARRTLARFRPFLYVENDRRDRASELVGLLDELDYAMYWHRPPLFNPKNYRNNPQNVFGSTVSVNMFCAHRSVPIQVVGARMVEVPRRSAVGVT